MTRQTKNNDYMCEDCNNGLPACPDKDCINHHSKKELCTHRLKGNECEFETRYECENNYGY